MALFADFPVDGYVLARISYADRALGACVFDASVAFNAFVTPV